MRIAMENPRNPPKQNRPRPASEQGFALITIIFLSAAVLIGLALSLPRAAMQAQRIREERLIYRGEQYKRAIQLYFRAHKKYPSEIDDLEETNGVRYLRQRYKDPMKEDEEWRFIRMGSDGRFKDSLIHDLEDPEKEGQGMGNSRNGNGLTAEQQPFQIYATGGQGPPVADGRFHGADRAREVRETAAPEVINPGDRPPGWVPGQTEAPQYDENGNLIPPPGAEGQDPNQQQEGQYPGYSRMRPGEVPVQQQPGFPGAQQPNQINPNTRGANRIGGAPVGFGGVTTAGAPVAGMPMGGMPGAGPQAVGGQAADVIRGILTSPRPGGLAGLQNNQRAQNQGSAFSGGIAGVATKAQEMGVKIYEGREMYNEWEFVYDYRKDDKLGGAAGPVAAAAPAASEALPAGQPGTTPAGTLGAVPGAVPYPPGYPAAGSTPPGMVNPRGRQGGNPYETIQTGPGGFQTTPQPTFGQRPGQRGFGQPQPSATLPPDPAPGVPLPGTTPGLPQPADPNQQPDPGVIYGPDGTPMPRRLR